MSKLKIKGWDTGFNKLKMTKILIERLALNDEQADEMMKAVSAGQIISLDIEDENFAQELSEELAATGAILETE